MAAVGRIRWPRILLGIALGVLLSHLIVIATSDLSPVAFAQDIELYLEATDRWLRTGAFYADWQLAGPYTIVHGAILYPPPILVLLLPFTVLPLALWWAIPVGVVVFVLWRLRPSALGWAGVVAGLAGPNSLASIANGNPVMWVVAALALGTVYAWPAVFAALKVSIGPVALFGCWRRSWWVAAAVAVAVSLAFLPMWDDYLASLLNSRNSRGLLYSVGDVWILAIPLAAWAGRTRDGVAGPGWLAALRARRAAVASSPQSVRS